MAPAATGSSTTASSKLTPEKTTLMKDNHAENDVPCGTFKIELLHTPAKRTLVMPTDITLADAGRTRP